MIIGFPPSTREAHTGIDANLLFTVRNHSHACAGVMSEKVEAGAGDGESNGQTRVFSVPAVPTKQAPLQLM